MQTPLRKRGKRETQGRAKGIKRTGRSFLFGLLLLGIVTTSGLFYTWERLTVESALSRNLEIEERLEFVRSRTELLSYEIASLESAGRIEALARGRMGMKGIDWRDVLVIGDFPEENR